MDTNNGQGFYGILKLQCFLFYKTEFKINMFITVICVRIILRAGLFAMASYEYSNTIKEDVLQSS